MPELLLEIAGDKDETLLVPLETAICLSVIEYTSSRLNVTLVLNEDLIKSSYCVEYKLSVNFVSSKITGRELRTKIIYTSLPTVILEDRLYYVAGLAAVLRLIVRNSERIELLGFRQCCLAAPAEVSSWTRFCEVDIVCCLQKSIFSNINKNDKPKEPFILNGSDTELTSSNKKIQYLPEELATLEYHLSIPAKVHQKGKYGKDGPRHDFVEGPHMVVSDLIIAMCVHLILGYYKAMDCDVIPFTQKWMKRVINDQDFASYLKRVNSIVRIEDSPVWCLPKIEGGPVDLYKKEGTRRRKIFTQGDLLTSSLALISEIKLMEYRKLYETSDLEAMSVILPDVPTDRLERKTQQLNNLAKAALQVAKDKDLIADLCCGSGHLGLLLAKLLPNCTIVLLDNKEKSSERARIRVSEMKLTNVRIVQSNLDYFVANFQVGVSLHACGVASDLVIGKCLKSRAHIVLCPCCYGGIQSNHMVSYPQSTVFQKTGLSERDFFVLGHNADTCDTENGHLAMTAVDSDRCFFISENGYNVTLSKLQPPDCTTRNNMIVAVHL